MAEIKVTISDPKTGKSYNKVLTDNLFLNRRLGESINGNIVGLDGYELKITGGSDGAGIPMRKEIPGVVKKKPMLSGGTGFHPKKRRTQHKAQHHYYLFKRKTVRGNTFSDATAQINLLVVKHGSQALDAIFPKTEKAAEAK